MKSLYFRPQCLESVVGQCWLYASSLTIHSLLNLFPPFSLFLCAASLTLGQFHRSFRRDSLSPYSYLSPSHNQNAFPLKGSDRTPLPPRTWPNSLGMLPGQVEASTFSDKGVPFPVLQRFPTEVTYTLQPSATSVHIQQGPQTMATSSQKYSSYAASAPYSQAYYPAGNSIFQQTNPQGHSVFSWLYRKWK